jgi:imidazolonepropionase-like amidohydrolase
MSEADALKALTLNPASLFHLESRIGSLEPGKDADFLILSGEPLEIESHVEQVFIEGKEVYNRAAGFSVYK